MRDLSSVAAQFETELLSINRVRARDTLLSLHDDTNIDTVIEQVVVPTLERIGTAWNDGRVALAQVFMAGRICEDIISALIPVQEDGGRQAAPSGPRIAIAVVQDYHLLGKRIVSSMLSASGYSISDYGGGLSPDMIVARVSEDNIDILLLSALMLPSALKIKQVTSLLRERGITISKTQ